MKSSAYILKRCRTLQKTTKTWISLTLVRFYKAVKIPNKNLLLFSEKCLDLIGVNKIFATRHSLGEVFWN